jgi:hypothetical protein
MVRSLSSIRAQVRLSAVVTNSLTDSSDVVVTHPALNYNPTITDGLDANQANRGWQSLSRTLENGAMEDIDIYDMGGLDIGAGAGNDGLGQALINEEIVGIVIVNESVVGSAAQLEIQPSTEQGWTPIGTHTVANGGALRGQGLLAKIQVADTAFVVTDGSNHRIRFKAVGDAITYSIYLLPRSDSEVSSSSSSSSISISTSSSSQSTSSSSQSESSFSSSSSSSPSSISTSSSSVSTSSSSSTSTSSQSSSSISTSSSSVSTSSSSSSISTSSSS